MAMLPSTIILGSSAECVQDVIRRFKGKSSAPSLASVAAYKDAVKQRDKPGFFAYADLAALAGRLDEMGKTLGPLEEQWRFIKAIINPKAVLAATASLTLQNGVLELKSRVDLDPSQSSPLRDLLTTKAAAPNVLYFTPRDGMLTLSLNLNDGQNRWQKLLELNDDMTKARPGQAERPKASAALHELEERIKLNIGKDVFGKLTSAAVTVDPAAAARPDGRFLSVLVLQATDADAAASLEKEGLPKLLGLASGKPSVVVRSKANDKISVVAAGELEGVLHTKNLYLGREGAILVVGADPKEVASALSAGVKKAGLLGEDKTATALKGKEDSTVVGVFSTARGIVDLFKQMEQPSTMVVVRPAVRVIAAVPGAPAAPPAKPAAKPEVKPLSLRAEKTIADAAKAVESLPPTVLNLRRKGDAVTVEMRQSGLRNTTRRLIDLAIDGALDRLLEQKPNGN